MTATRTAAVAALVGGIAWLAKVVLPRTDVGAVVGTDPATIAYYVGLVALVLALVAAGYSLAAKAPVWLRLVVAIAFPLLVLMVWVLLDEAARALYPSEGWLRDELNPLVTAVVAIVLGLWGLWHAHAAAPHPHAGNHRLTR